MCLSSGVLLEPRAVVPMSLLACGPGPSAPDQLDPAGAGALALGGRYAELACPLPAKQHVSRETTAADKGRRRWGLMPARCDRCLTGADRRRELGVLRRCGASLALRRRLAHPWRPGWDRRRWCRTPGRTATATRWTSIDAEVCGWGASVDARPVVAAHLRDRPAPIGVAACSPVRASRPSCELHAAAPGDSAPRTAPTPAYRCAPGPLSSPPCTAAQNVASGGTR